MSDYSHVSTADLITEGREIALHIATCKTALEAIESTLRWRALAMPHEPLENGSREGRRATLRDGDESLTVLFESDILKASFAANSSLTEELIDLVVDVDFQQLFKLKATYERRLTDGHKFRLHCCNLLGQETAARVIDLLKDRDKNGIVKSKSVVEWTRKKTEK